MSHQTTNPEDQPGYEPPTIETFLSTLLYAGGGDTPPESFWALQDFVNWANIEFDLHLVAPTEEDYHNEDIDIAEMLKAISDAIDKA